MSLEITYPADLESGRPLAESDSVGCQAFALCDRAAVGAYAHPVLGAVLSCQRCADRLGEALETVSVQTRPE